MTDFVGYRTVTVADPQLGITFPVAVLYPTTTPGRPEPVGAFTLDVALHAPIKAGAFPLVLISHGTGSLPWAYRTLAHFLARPGVWVALPEHPFNNRHDDTWAGPYSKGLLPPPQAGRECLFFASRILRRVKRRMRWQ